MATAVRLAIPTAISAMIPITGPPIGIIHVVGSVEPMRSAAATPTDVPRVAPKTSPIIFGQKAARSVLQSLARPPIFGHHEKPAPKLSSKAIRKFSHLLSSGVIGSAFIRTSNPKSRPITKIIMTMRIIIIGANIIFSLSKSFGPFTVMNHTASAAASPIAVSTTLLSTTFPVMPAYMASTDFDTMNENTMTQHA